MSQSPSLSQVLQVHLSCAALLGDGGVLHRQNHVWYRARMQFLSSVGVQAT